jgi:hypothetical protein
MLSLATIQYIKSMAELKEYFPEMRYLVATVLSILILALSFLLFLMRSLRLKRLIFKNPISQTALCRKS